MSLLRDARFTLRGWRRSPGPILAAVGALALATAGVTAVFSIVSGVLLRPLPYADPGRLVMVWQDMRARGGPERDWISPGLFVEWERRSSSLEAIGALRPWQPTLTGTDEAERVRGAAVSLGYFAALGVAPALGRHFTADEDRPGGAAVVILSDALWTRRYGRDRAVVGRSIDVDGQAAEVIGVMPASFRPAIADAEIWMPLRLNRAGAPRHMVVLRVVGRIRAGVGLEQARAEFATIATRLAGEDPEWDRARTALVPLHEDVVGAVRPMLTVLAAATGLVVLIACANLTSLLLARGAERVREITVLTALGAGRWPIVRQILTESLMLSAAGTAAGAAIGWWALGVLLALAPASAPRLAEVGIDATVLLIVAAASLGSAVLAGLAPALAVTRVDLARSLRDGGRESSGTSWMRSALVVVEVAVALMLVVGAALLVRTLTAMQRVDLGFTPAGVMTAVVQPPRTAYRDPAALSQLYVSLLERARAIPGVQSAALASLLPLSGGEIRFNFDIPGRPRSGLPEDDPVASIRYVSAGYIETMRMRLAEGRTVGPDDTADAPAVVLVNETLARRYWPGMRVLGRTIGVEGKQATIVGVVADVRHSGPAQPAAAELYLPYPQFPSRTATIVLRASGDPAALAPAIRAAVRALDPSIALALVQPMSVLVERTVAQPRFLAALLGGFAVLAVVVTLFGIYSVLSFTVSRRTREIGVRMALGAARPAVLALVLKESLSLVAIGLAAGTLAAAAAARLIRTLLFGVGPTDPATYAGMAALMALAALAASYAPAHRAARVNPVVALRDE